MTDLMVNNIDAIEKDLWEAADQLRANSHLTANQYIMPVLGLIFLRHASNRFDKVTEHLDDERNQGRMKRAVIKADYIKRGSLWLPKEAHWSYVATQSDLAKAITEAMDLIEKEYDPLQGVLPKEYGIFEPTLLEDLVRIFNREILNNVSGDVFGRINEYFLMQFAMLEAQDGGEFFTPPSLVQTIVNVIEPEQGIVLDPACGSGGMFVQTDHFIRRMGQETAKRVVFYGQESKTMNLKLGKMNLAVHALEGDIREANTFYQDEHNLVGKCDFVMANPPFNVDLVDAERIKGDSRLPFGLPGVNKDKKVSNANYLWISYFWSYLNEKGRAGYVMSSQASSAGNSERDVRQKLVETGDVDAMIAIRPNFFYTRTVPCELWFLDRNKPTDKKDKVLMIDAREIFRKVNRRVYDFSPEQLSNLSAIVWLYRGQSERFLNLVTQYFDRICIESSAIEDKIVGFNKNVDAAVKALGSYAIQLPQEKSEGAIAYIEGLKTIESTVVSYLEDCKHLLSEVKIFVDKYSENLPSSNEDQHKTRLHFEPIAEHIKDLVKRIDVLYRNIDQTSAIVNGQSLQCGGVADWKGISKLIKKLDDSRHIAVEQLKVTIYYFRQITWLQEKFPDAQICDVIGLVKVVNKKEIKDADWSLTPGRYVGFAPPEVDENFDFEQAITDLHLEINDLNEKASKLAATIQKNFEELGI